MDGRKNPGRSKSSRYDPSAARFTLWTCVSAAKLIAKLRRMPGRRLMFSMGLLTTLALGMLTRWPAAVRTLVERNPMSSMVPSYPVQRSDRRF